MNKNENEKNAIIDPVKSKYLNDPLFHSITDSVTKLLEEYTMSKEDILLAVKYGIDRASYDPQS